MHGKVNFRVWPLTVNISQYSPKPLRHITNVFGLWFKELYFMDVFKGV